MIKNVICLLNGGKLIGIHMNSKSIHTSAISQKIVKWKEYNEKMYPPQSPEETPRPAFVCHYKENIKYSPSKLWFIACLVRGMAVEEALKQLEFVQKKGALAITETILEAQKIAVEEHNVEFPSNLWVSESFVGKGVVLTGARRTRKGMSKIRYRYAHYFVTLEEGKPPKDYYYFKRDLTGEELLNNWLDQMRNRKIIGSI